jgi:2-succinyl-5-enolpyruvyl-6-hydroxy-3-cyclohexene-1-carboxylate synthase
LVLVTADRPHSLRGTWANQTTELQAGVFAGAVRLAVDVPAGEAVSGCHDAVRDAVAAASGDGGRRPGPAHLNMAFDDPLVPGDPWNPSAATVFAQPAVSDGVPARLSAGPRTVVVAGDGAGDGARRLAESAGWPLLAEPTSGARHGPNAVPAYRLLLGRDDLGGRVERVVAVGRPTLSRPVARLLARPDVEVVLVAPPWSPGPGREVTRFTGFPTVERRRVDGADAWLSTWQRAGSVAAQAIDAVVDEEVAAGRLCGPLLAREVWAATTTGERLIVAASNPVRDLDVAAPPSHEVVAHANRGLSGIDGTVSTAVGVAVASSATTRLLVGDLAFLHDLGGLALPQAELAAIRLQVVVLNDDGGGIFGLLEHGEPAHAQSFERVFGTPHGADLAALSEGLAVPYSRADDVAALRRALADVPRGLSVLEVRADRTRLRDLHARITQAVEKAVERAVEGLAGGVPAT